MNSLLKAILCIFLFSLAGYSVVWSQSLNILISEQNLLYYYPDSAPEALAASLPDDIRFVDTVRAFQAVSPQGRIRIKALPRASYDLASYMRSQLLMADIAHVQLATPSDTDLAVISSYKTLPEPPEPEPEPHLVFILHKQELCWYLSEQFPHIECEPFARELAERLLGDYDSRLLVVAFARNAGLRTTKDLMFLLDSAQIDIAEARNLNDAERNALGISEWTPEQDANAVDSEEED